MNTLKDDGSATINGPDNLPVTITINEELVRDALKVMKGDQSLMPRNSAHETSDTFILTGQSNYTFKDLIRREVELPLRVFMQHFTHVWQSC